ncbi:MAG: hypothetical protein E7535_07050 [Ruminococcaceae bacterium]|nr:hypothetical protein [Oscillospiraceae bacterium]
MKKNPFVNCGEQIKKFVRILYKISMLLSIGGGVVLTVCGLAEGGPEELIFWVGIAVAIVLPIIIHISSLFLYGFGEIVVNAEAQITVASGEKSEKSNEIPSL